MRCDKACEILADKSARFVQFRKVLFAMKGNADANGWASEISLRARLTPRVKECCRMQDTTTYLRVLRSVTACSCPRKGLPLKLCKGAKTPAVSEISRDRLARGCGRTAFNGRGRPARRTSWFASEVKGGQCPRGPTTLGRPTV